MTEAELRDIWIAVATLGAIVKLHHNPGKWAADTACEAADALVAAIRQRFPAPHEEEP